MMEVTARRPIAAVVVVLLTTAPSLAQAPNRRAGQAAKADVAIIINVPATAPWTDSGLTLNAGDRFQIRAWGEVRYGDRGVGRRARPNGSGIQAGSCQYVVTDRSVPAHSLVGNVAPAITFDGLGFFVGTNWTGQAPVSRTTEPTGHLLLGFNHGAVLCDRSGYDSWDFRNNNSGAFTVEVSISRAKAGVF